MSSIEIILTAVKEGRLSVEEGKHLIDDWKYRTSYPYIFPYITCTNDKDFEYTNDKDFEYTTTTI